MRTILITCLLRNNEMYIPYMMKMFNNLEKSETFNFNYLIYTNNNEDKTLDLLKESKKKNLEIIDESLSENIKKMGKCEKLYHLREKLLNATKKRNFDFLLMIDSDILFNLKIVEETVKELEKGVFDAITTNTLFGYYSMYFFYDTFAFKDNNGKKLESKLEKINFSLEHCFSKKTYKVKSSFSGFWITTKKTLLSKNPSYLDKIEPNKCEHENFNSKFNIGLKPNANPFRLETGDTKQNYDKAFNIIDKNLMDNRSDTKNALYFIFGTVIFIGLLLMWYFLIKH